MNNTLIAHETAQSPDVILQKIGLESRNLVV
jgi:hypothetical protein